MIRLVIIILCLALLMALLTGIDLTEKDHLMPESMMALGFTLIVAYLIGKLFMRFQMPKITGYIIAGIIAGPYLINLISKPVVQNLQLIDSIALSLIALTAGGEFRYKEIRPQMKTIGSAIFLKIILIFIGFISFFLIFGHKINFLGDASPAIILGTGLLIGAISVATSPATVIAVISETRAKGKYTDFVLGATVFKDIIVILLFSIILSISKPLVTNDASIHLDYVVSVILELLISIGVGVAAGALLLLYLKYVDKERTLFLLGFVLLGIETAKFLHMELVLVFMIAGFFVQNFSNAGGKLIEAIEGSSLPIYVIFFAIAGATLNLTLFLENWFIALFIVGIRLLMTFSGTYLGGKFTGASANINRYGWMGFVGQAGLSLGLSVMLMKTIPGPIGKNIATLIIASIAINQIIGPIMFRFSLMRAGDAK